ncbi:MAG: hypothetical protein WBV78_21135, partial [Roseobacter sp.]
LVALELGLLKLKSLVSFLNATIATIPLSGIGCESTLLTCGAKFRSAHAIQKKNPSFVKLTISIWKVSIAE